MWSDMEPELMVLLQKSHEVLEQLYLWGSNSMPSDFRLWGEAVAHLWACSALLDWEGNQPRGPALPPHWASGSVPAPCASSAHPLGLFSSWELLPALYLVHPAPQKAYLKGISYGFPGLGWL